MPLINFQAQWADAVEIGARHATGVYMSIGTVLPKRTTIRRPGRAKVGDTLYLYEGLRTKASRKLGEVMCLATTPVSVIANPYSGAPLLFLNDRLLTDARGSVVY